MTYKELPKKNIGRKLQNRQKIGAKTLIILFHIRLTSTTLPWKQNRLLPRTQIRLTGKGDFAFEPLECVPSFY